MNKRIILVASFFGLSAVALGAFGAHGLEGRITAERLETWETAVDYQFYHTVALLFLATFSRAKNTYIRFSFITFTLGILLFSGSLYLLSTRAVTGVGNPAILGPVTPIGGLCFILGWLGLFVATIKNKG
ncbi:Uncharacterized membrane protein YgdD, TMEM256/DUF423 family [Parapedobacter composti]|uniref:Uncharacterized membrane protein YgdD, TMEM256/DUF423 family n=1 Tax=Parapedobacter composti TaxID=623281 RepID=A0A1I1JV47_9SPHI|nr:DUF423 domain-containing protein [Parapedobacter composti]SFC51852.1 Uncharacterized membrane protein YgdD, TMEM256/DUF423 family [Parapedobacter composti]